MPCKCLDAEIAKLARGGAVESDGEILTLDEVAVYLKAGEKTVCRLAQQGEIPGFKLGGTWRFRRTELDRWNAAHIAEKTQDRT